jgi:uncharacterized protein (TIGR02246 family)
MTNDEQAIRDLIVTWLERCSAGDVEGLLELMTDDVVFLQPGQVPMRGRHDFAEAFKASTKSMRLEATSKIEELVVLGDWAYCSTYLVVALSKAATDEPPNKRVGYTLTILRKDGGRWRIARDANMLVAEPSGPD